MWTLFDRRDWLRFALLVAVMLGGSLLELLSLAAVPLFVALVAADDLGGEATRAVSALRHAIATLGLPHPDQTVLWGGVLLLLLFLVRTVYLVGSYALQERILQNRYIELASRLFHAYLDAPLTYHLQQNSATLVNNVHNETERIVRYVLDTTLNLIRNALTLVAILALLLWHSPLVSIGSFAVLGLAAGSFLLLTKRRLARLGEQMGHQRARVTQNALEGLGAIRDAQLLNCQHFFAARLHQTIHDLAASTAHHNLISRSTWPFMELITCTVIIGTMAAMLLAQHNPSDIAPTIALVAACLARLKGNITETMVFYAWRQSHLPIAKRIADDLTRLQPHHNTSSASDTPNPPLPDAPCDIHLHDVTFAYPEQHTPALSHVSLDIPAGSSLGIVGPTGSGKSTLAAVIAALLPTQHGSLAVNGNTLRSPRDIRSWQDHIGYVAQDIFLLDDSLKANIAFGIPPERIDDHALHNAVQAAQLTDFIHTLPHGLDTLVGERGVRLSGGQRQRIAIARALYRNPACLIFDEATSALDVTTEADVSSAIEHLRGHHTIVIIAHRLTTIRHCDRIAFLKDGTIVACDSFDNLRHTLPEFRAMTASLA
ncbi:MAG: ABC transporter ATP-binding protein [Oligosphaeraceae bacterium]